MKVTRDYKATMTVSTTEENPDLTKEELEFILSKKGIKETTKEFEEYFREFITDESGGDTTVNIKITGLKYTIHEEVEATDESTN